MMNNNFKFVRVSSKNTQNFFAYNSATKYHSEAVLKRMVGYPLSPHIKTIAVAFLQAE